MKKVSDEEVKKEEVNILKAVHDYCIFNNLKYFVAYGTLLGTIRHKGFIPWDDDIDICMLREDYNKLIKHFNSDNDKYKLTCSLYDENYPYNFAKVYNPRTVLIERLYHKYKIGVYIDVFPIDEWYEENDKTVKHIKFLQKVLKAKFYVWSKDRSLFKNLILYFTKFILMPVNSEVIIKKIDKMAKNNSYSELSPYVGNITANTYGLKEKMVKKWFYEFITLPFENIQVQVPKQYEFVLKQLYGDYQQLPPEEKRITHHTFDVWFY